MEAESMASKQDARAMAALLAAAVGLAAGCAGHRASGDGGVNTGLAASGDGAGRPAVPDPTASGEGGSSLEQLAAQSAANLQIVMDQMDRDAAARGNATTPESTPASMKLATPPSAVPPPTIAKAEEPAPDLVPPPAPEKPLAQRIDETAMSLVDLLRQQAVTGTDTRKTYMALAALEAFQPGASQQVITPRSLAADPLTVEDRAAVDGVRELVAAMAATPSGKSFAAALRDVADRAGMTEPVRIGAARLCTRVNGYGRITPLQNTKLMQGRPERAIVYVELAGFAQRPATEAEASAAESPTLEGRPRFAVDVSQELKLYHDADGVLAWQQPEQQVLETSTNRRRDFYLVQQITLPETLTVGAYRLKVVVKDRTTGAQDEATVAIEVVADPTLALQHGDS
jgi:hypothetical protein